jgi:hypothetical protein
LIKYLINQYLPYWASPKEEAHETLGAPLYWAWAPWP